LVTTLLVANRGEIARRIFRTARRMGMRTVAVYSDADALLPFVREADAAIRIGPAPAPESYLAIDRVIAAAREAKADLVHPGYGFLAERPEFASAVDAAGMRFVGPPASVLTALGDKAEAKALAERVNVPTIPGYRGEDQSDEAFIFGARSVGYPVMLKPVAGGGGIGMQTVREERELRDALARARRIATAAFGDERLLLERLVEHARHIEVQILADDHGTVISVGDRDCSAQRRHQKIVEEAPAPFGTDKGRQRMADSAIAIAREAGYRGAGTVEFVVDDRSFFFLEVNARLQVEHPVTEMVFGVDLVEQQLRSALGERLDFQARQHGRQHAVEARVYAEDPAAGFLPSTGRLVHVRWPDRPGVRVDAGYEEGDVVTRHYDPLLAKVIAFGGDRRIALGMLANALDETEILGVRTNLGFLRALVRRLNKQGTMSFHTELVEGILPELIAAPTAAPDAAYAVAAAAIAGGARDRRDPWTATGAWRIGEGSATTIVLREGAREQAVRLSGSGPYAYAGHRVAAVDEAHRWLVDGSHAAAAASDGVVWASVGGVTWELATGPREREVEATAGAEVAAPMPGLVIAAQALADRHVRRGDLLFVVEAMKMELRVEAPADGKVTRVLASVGQQVERGQRLAEFEADTA
jgi:acetyl/propionyl-CoA carboxylase alpha subunit